MTFVFVCDILYRRIWYVVRFYLKFSTRLGSPPCKNLGIYMRMWRNWQTRWFQVPVSNIMWVQVPSSAPQKSRALLCFFISAVWVRTCSHVHFVHCGFPTARKHTVVEYTLSNNLSPAMVADYTLQLPDKKLLQEKLRDITKLTTSTDEE